MSGIIGSAGSKSGIVNFQRPFGIARGNTGGMGAQSSYEFINWTNVDQGGQSYFNNSTGRFTAPIKGYYHFWMMFLKNNHDPVARMYIRKNNIVGSGLDSGAQGRSHGQDGTHADSANYSPAYANVIYQLDAGEFVSCYTITGYIENSLEYTNFAWQHIQEN